MKNKSNKAQVRKAEVETALKTVRGLVKVHGSSIVQGAINIIKDEERANRELREAEEKVAALKKRVKK